VQWLVFVTVNVITDHKTLVATMTAILVVCCGKCVTTARRLCLNTAVMDIPDNHHTMDDPSTIFLGCIALLHVYYVIQRYVCFVVTFWEISGQPSDFYLPLFRFELKTLRVLVIR
jgi:hypothetical protein